MKRVPSLTVYRVGDEEAPPFGTLDPDILIWCEMNYFLLVTDNRSTMPVHLSNHLAAGRHVPGILEIRPKANIGDVLNTLEDIAVASIEDEYRDRIEYIPFA
jgi:hypothetical protein